MYDALVIGARCAGAPTAMLLARKGYKVLLVDRAAFPSDIPHGHFIHRHGPRRLHQWGLLQRIADTNCPAITTVTTNPGDFPLTAHDMCVDGVALGYAPRRSVLDALLVQAAVEAGAEFREQFAMQDLLVDEGRVIGIRGVTKQGTHIDERATIVIGADGRNSRLAAAVAAPVYDATPALTCWYFAYWSGMRQPGLDLHVMQDERRAIFAFPTNDDLCGVFVAWPADELPVVRANVEARFMEVIDRVPEFAARLRGGRRETRFAGATDVPNFLRKPFGAGWVLVGDAGCHKDPFLALGMCDAFRDVDLLVDALDQYLAEERPFDEALREYEAKRNGACRADYELNLKLAQFTPLAPDMARIRAAIRGDAAATRQFYLASEGMIPRESFFNADNLGRLLAAAATAAPAPAAAAPVA